MQFTGILEYCVFKPLDKLARLFSGSCMLHNLFAQQSHMHFLLQGLYAVCSASLSQPTHAVYTRLLYVCQAFHPISHV